MRGQLIWSFDRPKHRLGRAGAGHSKPIVISPLFQALVGLLRGLLFG